jgi:hypothetical protein
MNKKLENKAIITAMRLNPILYSPKPETKEHRPGTHQERTGKNKNLQRGVKALAGCISEPSENPCLITYSRGLSV